MKPIKFLLFTVIIFGITSCETKQAETPGNTPQMVTPSREFYQLKIYTFDTDEQVQTTDSYLEKAFLPRLKKLAIKSIGVFKPSPNEADSVRNIFVLIPFSSMEQFLGLEEELNNDQAYMTAGSEYIDASYDNPPYARIESILLQAFADMPVMQIPEFDGPRADRVYELRSYESATERYYNTKVDMFNAGGEVKLFDRLEFNAVFYGEVISGPKMPNLMYMTTFSDQASRDEHWSAFVEAPEWKELIALPKYDNTVSHADITFLYPTDYSDY